ncbi:MAG: hypothetical protein FJ284_03725 [Planctomycetes bacterium]|nr:hypothetical protein [Planctomycetota bacterium]
MAIDTYAPCPGGTGKKIKFCCSDLVGDLEQIDRLMEGDQITAALDQVKRLEEKHPGRACLMATRTKLELATKQLAAAARTSRGFLEAFPENPLALGHAAISEALEGRIQQAAGLFDKAREAAAVVGREAGGEGPDASTQLVRIAATLVQAAAQSGHVGFGQGLVDWIGDLGLGSEDERRMLAAIVASSGVPAALRTRMPLEEAEGDESWRPDFETALKHARGWRLSKALTAFSILKGVAGSSRPLHANLAVICEMLARPVEASESWLAVARLPDTSADDAIEATGRAVALETEANPERSPLIRFVSRIGPLAVPAGEEGATEIGLLEDKLRHDSHGEPAAIDRSAWVSRNAAPPRSAWRIYDDGDPARLLASLLIFGRQTDREPEAVLQGFGPDVELAVAIVEPLCGCRFAAADEAATMPGVTPTNWLLGSQFRMALPTTPPAPPAAGEPAVVDVLMERQRRAALDRFAAVWPTTPLPELLGKTPRQAVAEPEGCRRVEAMLAEGEATARRGAAAGTWAAVRESLGLPTPSPVDATEPLGEVRPLRWHRLTMSALPIEQLRGVFVTALDAGFDSAAERAAESLVARADATPADRWEALGALAERAESSVRRLELIGQLRGIAKELKVSEGMLDVAELRVRMQRGDEPEASRLLQRLQRDHGRDRQVLQALAEVLMEAGVDLGAVAGRAAAGGGAAAAATTPAAAGRLWTPGSGERASGGDKKTIWTPGS